MRCIQNIWTDASRNYKTHTKHYKRTFSFCITFVSNTHHEIKKIKVLLYMCRWISPKTSIWRCKSQHFKWRTAPKLWKPMPLPWSSVTWFVEDGKRVRWPQIGEVFYSWRIFTWQEREVLGWVIHTPTKCWILNENKPQTYTGIKTSLSETNATVVEQEEIDLWYQKKDGRLW